MQLPPGVPPFSIKDPELRRKYEADIAGNTTRFATQNKLHVAMAAPARAAATVLEG